MRWLLAVFIIFASSDAIGVGIIDVSKNISFSFVLAREVGGSGRLVFFSIDDPPTQIENFSQSWVEMNGPSQFIGLNSVAVGSTHQESLWSNCVVGLKSREIMKFSPINWVEIIQINRTPNDFAVSSSLVYDRKFHLYGLLVRGWRVIEGQHSNGMNVYFRPMSRQELAPIKTDGAVSKPNRYEQSNYSENVGNELRESPSRGLFCRFRRTPLLTQIGIIAILGMLTYVPIGIWAIGRPPPEPSIKRSFGFLWIGLGFGVLTYVGLIVGPLFSDCQYWQ